MKHILLLSTGGTIASLNGKDGLVPVLTALEMANLVPIFKNICNIDFKPVLNIDSSNLQPEDWILIANEAFDGLKTYDGVIITHGTDTMAYTSSMLSFMFKNLNKPLILTGSQRPITALGTDAKQNIFQSILVANYDLPGVYIVYNSKIIKGCRAVKTRTMSFNAFESINIPYIGHIEDDTVIINNPPSYNPNLDEPFELDINFNQKVFLHKLIPGTQPEFYDSFKKMDYAGLVIESFGLGGLPFIKRNLIPKIYELMEAGIAVVVTTQCLYEGSDITVYEVGNRSARAGVIPGYDMTTEAAITKLMFVLSHAEDMESIKKLMLTNMCDEINIT